MRNTVASKFGNIAAISAFTLVLAAPALAQSDTETVIEALTPAALNAKLEIKAMDCTDKEDIAFDCVTDYLDDVGDSLTKVVGNNLKTIREQLEKAENAETEFDDLMQLAKSVAELSAEGGPLSVEMDRIGALIQKYKEDAASDPDTEEFVAAFQAEFERWQEVRDRMINVRQDALDVMEELEGGKARVVTLLRLKAIKKAIDAADKSVAGMERVVAALEVTAETARKPLEDGGD